MRMARLLTPEVENFLKLATAKGVGFKFLQRFYSRYRTFGGNFEENLREFLKDYPPSKAKAVVEHLQREEFFKKLFTFLGTNGIEVIPFFGSEYPAQLLKWEVPALYLMGELPDRGFSIVGTRRAGAEGRKKARLFAQALAQNGFTVISGGASGIDLSAHLGAIEAGGKTGVVLGEGIYHFLKRHPAFAEKVLKGGGFILSQFSPFTAGARWTFPKRNALIAYFGNFGTLVVEAPEKSGALITADFARKMGRKVYAYIGCTSNPNYRGCVNLVSSGGAKLVVEPQNLLSDISDRPLGENKNPAHPLERLIAERPRTLDELLALTSMGKGELTALLTQWELEGKVSYQGGFYIWSG